MINLTCLSLLPVLLGLFAADREDDRPVSRLLAQEEQVMRVPVQPRAPAPHIDWVERKGPKCIPLPAIRRALLSGDDQVDFVLANRRRVRAQFDDGCPALDFYGGFYVRSQDEMLCADRDAIHSRMGGSCTIERFRDLEPKVRD